MRPVMKNRIPHRQAAPEIDPSFYVTGQRASMLGRPGIRQKKIFTPELKKMNEGILEITVTARGKTYRPYKRPTVQHVWPSPLQINLKWFWGRSINNRLSQPQRRLHLQSLKNDLQAPTARHFQPKIEVTTVTAFQVKQVMDQLSCILLIKLGSSCSSQSNALRLLMIAWWQSLARKISNSHYLQFDARRLN